MKHFARLLLLVAAGSILTGHCAPGQGQQLQEARYQRRALSVTFGGGFPLSKAPLTDFWNPGPAASVSFFVYVNRSLAFGVGADAALYSFDGAAFAGRFPTVAVQRRNIAYTGVHLAAKYSPRPTVQLAPYLLMTVGAMRMTPACYKTVIGGVRVTYYEIPGRTRLAVGLGGGAELYISRWLALEGEAKVSMTHNDQEVGSNFFVRTGFRFVL